MFWLHHMTINVERSFQSRCCCQYVIHYTPIWITHLKNKPNTYFSVHIKSSLLFLSSCYEVSLSQCLLWWHLLCFRGEPSDSQWRTWSTHHAGLIYFEFCRVCVASDLLRDHIDVAIACCCFVLGSKKAEHEDKVWRIMLPDRQSLLLVDIAGRGCDCACDHDLKEKWKSFSMDFLWTHCLLIVFSHSHKTVWKRHNCWLCLKPVSALQQLFGFTWIKLNTLTLCCPF